MMRPIIAWLLFLLLAGPANAEENENLFLLGKTWGYLKYHHPLVRQGCFDWDQELLERVDGIAAAATLDEARGAIATWVRDLDESAGECEQAELGDVHLSSPAAWIEDSSILGEALTNSLQAIAKTRVPSSSQYYVSQQAGVGNPYFSTENPYSDLEFPGKGHRLLALFRFWNIIEYWFPYRDQIDDDWDAVLREFIPRLISASTNDEYVLELMALIARIQDGHANLWSALDKRPPAGQLRVQTWIRMVEGQPFVWRASRNADSANELVYGDVILAVDGTPVEELMADWIPYYGVSNDSALGREMAHYLLRGDEGFVSITVDRAGERKTVVADRGKPRARMFPHDREGDTLQMLNDDVVYLKLSTVEDNGGTEYAQAALGKEGLIIDIRNYPAAFMVFSLGQHLVSEPTEFARFTRGDLDFPGVFRWSDPIALQPQDPYYGGRVVIIVNESSQSQAEYTAMALRAGTNALVVGSQTAGADGNVSRISLPGGHMTMISGIGVFYPDKTPTQRVGIVPDAEVRPTIEGLRAGRDEVLEVAVREILGDSISEEELRRITRIPHARVIEE